MSVWGETPPSMDLPPEGSAVSLPSLSEYGSALSSSSPTRRGRTLPPLPSPASPADPSPPAAGLRPTALQRRAANAIAKHGSPLVPPPEVVDAVVESAQATASPVVRSPVPQSSNLILSNCFLFRKVTNLRCWLRLAASLSLVSNNWSKPGSPSNASIPERFVFCISSLVIIILFMLIFVVMFASHFTGSFVL